MSDDETLGVARYELPRSSKDSQGSKGTSLSKDVVQSLTRSSSIFISYLTAMCARVFDHAELARCLEQAAQKNQKTLSAAHVLEAISQLDWPEASELRRRLENELEVFRQPKAKKAAAPKKSAPAAATTEPAADVVMAVTDDEADDVPADDGAPFEGDATSDGDEL